jgi:hypothetical protein
MSAHRLVQRRLAGALAAFAALAASARGGETATVPHVLWKSGDVRFSGWRVAEGGAGAIAIATDAGELRVVAKDAGLEEIARSDGPVAEVPSGALAHGLAAADLKVRDRCQDLLRAQKEIAHPALGAALDDDSAEARRRALELLVRLPSPNLASPIRRHLTDPDEGVRKFALRAYALLAPEDLLDRVTWVLQHDDATAVAHEAIVQLGRTHDLHGVDALLDHLADCDERSLRVAAFDSLRRLTARDFGRDEEQWRAWWTNHRKEIVGGDDPPPPAPKKKAKKLASR